MLSTILCRRSLLPNNSSCTSSSTILYNQFARRWKTTSKKKGKVSFAKRKKLTLTTAANDSKKSTKPIIDASKQSLQSRGNTINIEKARHMQQPKITASLPSKVFTWVQANPFLPIVIVLPTFTMGIIIWSRPEVWTNRAKFLGGTGGESDTKKMIPTEELPVYDEEEVESGAAIEDDGKKDDEEWEMVDNVVTVSSIEQEEKLDEKPAAVDLLYAVGIRPHSSQ